MRSSSQPTRGTPVPGASGKATWRHVISRGPLETAFWKWAALELIGTLLKGSDKLQKPPGLRLMFIKSCCRELLLTLLQLVIHFCDSVPGTPRPWGPCTNNPAPVTHPPEQTQRGGDVVGSRFYYRKIEKWSSWKPYRKSSTNHKVYWYASWIQILVWLHRHMQLTYYVIWLSTGKNWVILMTCFPRVWNNVEAQVLRQSTWKWCGVPSMPPKQGKKWAGTGLSEQWWVEQNRMAGNQGFLRMAFKRSQDSKAP